jgi:hypothetical protein
MESQTNGMKPGTERRDESAQVLLHDMIMSYEYEV